DVTPPLQRGTPHNRRTVFQTVPDGLGNPSYQLSARTGTHASSRAPTENPAPPLVPGRRGTGRGPRAVLSLPPAGPAPQGTTHPRSPSHFSSPSTAEPPGRTDRQASAPPPGHSSGAGTEPSSVR